MDAGELEFPNAAFDVALAPYVMSVVPHRSACLDEAWRVLRPGGDAGRDEPFRRRSGIRETVERRMEKAAEWLGWHPNFPYDAIGDWIAAHPDARLVERRALPPIKLFTLLRVRKAAD